MKKVEVNDFCKYKFLSNVEYSPNQKVAALVVSTANEKENSYGGNIYVYEKGKLRQLTAMNNERGFFFEDDENILFATARTEEEKNAGKEGDVRTNYYRINIHGGEARPAFSLPYGGGISKRIDKDHLLIAGSIDVEYPDYYKMSDKERKEVAKKKKENKDYEVFDEWPFWFNGGGIMNKTRSALFVYDIKKNKSERITEPTMNVGDAIVHDGAIYYSGAAYEALMPLSQDVYKYDLNTKKTTKVFDGSDFFGIGVAEIGRKIVLFATEGKKHGINENSKIYELNEKSGAIRMLVDPDISLYGSAVGDCGYGGGMGQRNTDRLYTLSTRRNAVHLYAYDEEGQEEAIIQEEGIISCFDIKKDNSEILFVAQYEQKLQELYSYKNGKIKQLTHINDAALKGRYVAIPEKMTIKSEGLDIDGWVLKPIDFDEKKKYPAILEVHGGPKCVFSEAFFHEMQYFASQGYFVFFCNPIGGDGRGNAFADIRGHYGDTDYKNLMDFTDAVLKKYPQIDPKRVGETGGSYGGFMTNWIVSHTNRFACAATQRSISNWISFYGISDIGPYFATDQTDADIKDNMEKMWNQSPLKYVDNVKTPLLFIHSDEDYRCPLSQGLQFYTALVNRGIETRMCMFHGENHELSRSGKPQHRIRRLTEIRQWMDKYLK